MTSLKSALTRWTSGLLRHELVRRSALFSLSIALSTVVAIFSIPLLVTKLGVQSWGQLAVLQAVMQFVAVAVAFGWGATGPAMIAAEPRSSRRSFFARSVLARVIIAVVAAPAGIAIAVAISQADVLQVSLAALAFTMPGLGAAWYFVGTNRPGALFVFDALPSILGQITGLLAVTVSPSLTSYLICAAAFGAAGLVASWTYVLTLQSDGELKWGPIRDIPAALRDQLAGVSATLTSTLSSTLPTVLVQIAAPGALPVFVILDRLLKYAVLVLAPVLQAVQGWIPEAGQAATPRRARLSAYFALGIGLVGGALLTTFAPIVSSLLTVGQASIPLPLAILGGLAFAGEAVAQVTGLACLVALGATSVLALSATVAAGAGLGLVFALTLAFGAGGAVAGVAATSLGLAIYRLNGVFTRARVIEARFANDSDS